MQCSAEQCREVQCSAMQCSAVQCSAVQFNAVQLSAASSKPGNLSVDDKGKCYWVKFSFYLSHFASGWFIPTWDI